jgi:hypothetical protein
VSSAAQNPTGQPTVVAMVGLATRINTLFGVVETVSTRM